MAVYNGNNVNNVFIDFIDDSVKSIY